MLAFGWLFWNQHSLWYNVPIRNKSVATNGIVFAHFNLKQWQYYRGMVWTSSAYRTRVLTYIIELRLGAYVYIDAHRQNQMDLATV